MTDKSEALLDSPSGAVFSNCRNYRYALWRNWDPGASQVLFVGLNPSRASENHNDPTIRRCLGFARDWGYGGVLVANIYAYCATRPVDLFKAEKPLGTDNQKWLLTLCNVASMIICCWGNHGLSARRSLSLLKTDKPLYYLKLNRSGAPAHPLYLPKNSKPVLWRKRGF